MELLRSILLLALALTAVLADGAKNCAEDKDCPGTFCQLDKTCFVGLSLEHLLQTGTPDYKNVGLPTGTGEDKKDTEKITSEVERLSATVTKNKETIEGLKNNENQVKLKIKELEELITKVKAKDAAKHTSILIEINKMVSKTERTDITIKRLVQKNTEYRLKVESLKKTIEEHKQQIGKEEGSDKALHGKLQKLKATIDTLTDSLGELNNQEGKLLKGIADLAFELKDQKRLITESRLFERIAELEKLSKAQETKLSNLFQDADQFLKGIDALNKQLKLQSQKIKETKELNAKTSQELNEFTNTQNVAQENIKKTGDAVKAKVGELETEIKLQTEQLTKLFEKESSTQAQVDAFEKAFNAHVDDLTKANLPNRVTDLEKMVGDQGNKINNLKTQETLVKEKLVTLDKTIGVLTKQINDPTLKNKVASMYQELQKQAKTIKDLIQKENAQLERIIALEKKLTEEAAKVENLGVEGKLIKDRVAKLEASIKAQAKETEEISKREAVVLDDLKNLKGLFSGQTADIGKLTEKDKEINGQVSELQDLTNKQESELKVLNNKENAIREKIKELQNKITDVSKELNEEEALNDLKKLQDDLKDQTEKVKQLHKQKAECMKKMNKLGDDLKNNAEQISQLNDKESELAKGTKALEDKLKAQTEEIGTFAAKENDLKKRIEALEKTVVTQAEQMNERITQESEFKKQLAAIKKQVGEQTDAVAALKDMATKLAARASGTEAAYLQIQKRVAVLYTAARRAFGILTRLANQVRLHSKLLNDFAVSEQSVIVQVGALDGKFSTQNQNIADLASKDKIFQSKIEEAKSKLNSQGTKIGALTVKDTKFNGKCTSFAALIISISKRLTIIEQRDTLLMKRIVHLLSIARRLHKVVIERHIIQGPVIKGFNKTTITHGGNTISWSSLSKCRPHVDLMFNKEQTDFELQKVKRVELPGHGWVAQLFRETDKHVDISFPMFTGQGFYTKHLQVDFRVKLEKELPATGKVALVTNGDANNHGSIEILVDRENFYFQVVLHHQERNGALKVIIPRSVANKESVDGWYSVQMVYRPNDYFSGSVGKVTERFGDKSKLNDHLAVTPYPLRFGKGWKYHDFAGYLDYFLVWHCKPVTEAKEPEEPINTVN